MKTAAGKKWKPIKVVFQDDFKSDINIEWIARWGWVYVLCVVLVVLVFVCDISRCNTRCNIRCNVVIFVVVIKSTFNFRCNMRCNAIRCTFNVSGSRAGMKGSSRNNDRGRGGLGDWEMALGDSEEESEQEEAE